MRPKGLFVGLTTFDLIHYVARIPEADEKVEAASRWTGAGGPAANAAATFAALGGEATLVTAVGQGVFARAATADLEARHVRVIDLCSEGELPTSCIVVDESGERTVVSTNAHGMRLGQVPRGLSDEDAFDTIGIDSHYPQVVDQLTPQGSRPKVVLDPGSRKPHAEQLMERSDHILISRAFSKAMSLEELLSFVKRHSPRLVAVSQGNAPLVAEFDGQRTTVPIPRISAIDTLGAGDVLHGAYAYAMASGHPIERALSDAVSVASASCERRGPRIEA